MTHPARRWIAIVVWLLALVAGLVVVWQARFTADMSFFLPSEPTPRQKVLVDQLGDGTLSRMLMLAIEAPETADAARLSKALADKLKVSSNFSSVQNGAVEDASAERDYLLEHRYLLSPAVDVQRFSVDGLRSSILSSIDMLSSSAGDMLKPFFLQDPTGELWAQVEQIGLASQPEMAHGVWFSRDGRRAMLLLQTRAAGPDTDGQTVALNEIQSTFDALISAQNVAGAGLQVSGPGVFAVRARSFIQEEVTRVTLVGVCIIVVILLMVYRSPWRLVTGLLPVVSGALAGVVAVALVHGTVFGITIGFGSALIGEGVDYAVYYFLQAGAGGEAQWRQRFWPTIRLGVLTSVAGFGAMLMSGFPGLSQLGLYAVAGVVTAAAVTRWVLPAVAPATPLGPHLQRWGTRVGQSLRALTVLRWPVWLLSALALALLLGRHDRLWSEDLSVLNTASPADMATDAVLRQDLGAPDVRYLVLVRAKTQEAVLQEAERVAARLQTLLAERAIGGFDTPTRFLPSQATQAARQAALPSRDELVHRLSLATDGLPVSASRLTPFVDAVERARQEPLLTPDAMGETALALAVQSMLTAHDGAWQVLMSLRTLPDTGDLDVARVRQALAGTEALLVDMKSELDSLYEGYMQQAIALSLGGAAVILALLSLSLRSWRRVVRVVVPMALTVVLLMAGLHLAGQSLHLLHLVGLLLVLAVGSNYGLFFDSGDALDAMAPETLAAMAVANVTTTVGFGVLGFSNVPMLQAMGVTVGPGALLVLALSAVFAARGPNRGMAHD